MGKLNLQYLVDGNGDYVTAQIPAPGTKVKENDIVLLIFGWGEVWNYFLW